MRSLKRPHVGFTLVELLVVIAVIGVLMGLTIPAVQAIRSSARRAQCGNNIRQVGLATIQHLTVHGKFPVARTQNRPGDPIPLGQTGEEPNWLVRVLPFMEMNNAYDGWDLKANWFDQPAPLLVANSPILICPTRHQLGAVAQKATSNSGGYLPCGCPIPAVPGNEVTACLGDYAGNLGDLSPGSIGAPTDFYYGGNGTGVIIASRGRYANGALVDWVDFVRDRDVLDGLSHTVLAGEKQIPYEQIGQFPFDSPQYDSTHWPASVRVGGPGVPLQNGTMSDPLSFIAFGSWHPGGVNFVFADGRVQLQSLTTDTDLLAQLLNRADRRAMEEY